MTPQVTIFKAGVDLKFLREQVRVAACEELLPRFADVQRHIKRDGSIVTEADHAMQSRMQKMLAEHWPQYDFLGEEMSRERHEKLTAQPDRGLWCLDPLDGTSNFTAGLPYFCVSLALLVEGRMEVGLIYDPVRDECFMAQRGKGAWLNGISMGTMATLGLPLQRCIAVVDFKRLKPDLAATLAAHPPFGSQRNFGSSALDWCWLADGRFHIYLHGGQKLWDYAAGSLILAEAGGKALTLDGEEVMAPDLQSRSVVATLDPDLFHIWMAWVREHHRP
jgi:myo-inositol-1(or 4)-monophosphatase